MFINFILQKIKYNYILFNHILTIICSGLMPHIKQLFDTFWEKFHSLWKRLWQSLEFGFDHQSILQQMKKCNNQLVQEQVIMINGVETTNQVPKFFYSMLFMLYMALCYGKEQYFFYWQVHGDLQSNFHGHIADTGCINLVYHCVLRTLNE